MASQAGSGARQERCHVSLVALPDAVVSTLFDIYDVLNGFAHMGIAPGGPGGTPPFQVDVVGETAGRVALASAPVDVPLGVATIERSDVAIVPSVPLRREGWTTCSGSFRRGPNRRRV